MVPIQYSLDSGSSVEKFTNMLAGLTPAESKKWMNEHSRHHRLGAGTSDQDFTSVTPTLNTALVALSKRRRLARWVAPVPS